VRSLPSSAPLLVAVGVDFSDEPSGEPHHRRSATRHAVGLDHNARSGRFCLHKGIGKIVDFVPHYFTPIGIRKMTIGGQHRDFSERRIHPCAAVHIIGPSDFDAGRLVVVRNYLRLRKSSKVVDKVIGTIRRYVNPIFRNSL
jgi:hypothetical protein